MAHPTADAVVRVLTDNVVKFFGPIETLQAVLAHEPAAEFRMAAAAKPLSTVRGEPHSTAMCDRLDHKARPAEAETTNTANPGSTNRLDVGLTGNTPTIGDPEV